jgi:pimeloyl-ACP methyl ester carboxylesterase
MLPAPPRSRRLFQSSISGALLVLLAMLASFANCTTADAAPGKRPGHVYLLRGILNVFSLGMDQLAYKLEAVGVSTTVANHTSWRGLADDMVANYRSGNHEPIILMGHSAGADATISIARRLQDAGVPVALIVNFDPVSPDPVPANVKQIVNYYVPAGWGAAVAPGQRFKGQLANVSENATDNHFSIDKSEDLHRKTIARVLAVTSGVRRGAAKKKPAQQMSAVPAP